MCLVDLMDYMEGKRINKNENDGIVDGELASEGVEYTVMFPASRYWFSLVQLLGEL